MKREKGGRQRENKVEQVFQEKRHFFPDGNWCSYSDFTERERERERGKERKKTTERENENPSGQQQQQREREQRTELIDTAAENNKPRGTVKTK
ncbi:unnamed protein product [Linum trigynum]|uniref:Uncharacterized protein n=1 Tax=Linum trigynum TaxID=586398 RepID=A0AAV2G2V8_9ROSI